MNYCVCTHRCGYWGHDVCQETNRPSLRALVQNLASEQSSFPTEWHQDMTRTRSQLTLKQAKHIQYEGFILSTAITTACVADLLCLTLWRNNCVCVDICAELDWKALRTSTHTHFLHRSWNYIVSSGGTDERLVVRPHQCMCLREISKKWRRNQEVPVFMEEP